MTNYNKRLDDVLDFVENYGVSASTEGFDKTDSRAKAKQAITSLIKELVAEAKEQLPTSEQLTTKSGYHVPGKMYGYKLGLHDAREAIDQFEQNLLKAWEEV